MFQALLSHPQEVLYKRHLVYCVRVMSAGCTCIGVPAPPEDEQVMLETCKAP
jgi:hypothetical protein